MWDLVINPLNPFNVEPVEDSIDKGLQFKNSDAGEVYHTNTLILLIRIMLCSKLASQF
jgi:hypothetical protein